MAQTRLSPKLRPGDYVLVMTNNFTTIIGHFKKHQLGMFERYGTNDGCWIKLILAKDRNHTLFFTHKRVTLLGRQQH